MIAIGILARFAISAASLGTNDAAAWVRFGDEVRHFGLLHTYQADLDFNHPPIPGLWAAFASAVAGSGESVFSNLVFTNVFRLPAILADCAGVWLLYLIWRKRIGPERALQAAALFALSLDAILVSGFHCNTDPVYVMLCVLAAWLIEDREAPFLGGLALGAAINVKIIPVLLILPLLLSFRRWQDAARFLAGLALWVLPFVPELWVIRGKFIENVLKYNSSLDRWGVNFFALLGQSAYDPNTPAGRFAWVYYFNARYLILGLIVLWAVAGRVWGRWTRYELVAMTFVLFLVFTPGFGVQYTVLAGLPIFACRPKLGAVYGLVAGAFIGSIYFFWWSHGAANFGVPPFSWPVFCQFEGLIPRPAAWIGLLAWGLLIGFAIGTLLRPKPVAG